jgi:hypothetical protein
MQFLVWISKIITSRELTCEMCMWTGNFATPIRPTNNFTLFNMITDIKIGFGLSMCISAPRTITTISDDLIPASGSLIYIYYITFLCRFYCSPLWVF